MDVNDNKKESRRGITSLPGLPEIIEAYVRSHWDEEFKRPESILTDRQRRFLCGFVEYTGDRARKDRYDMRDRIRNRYINGLRDLEYLASLDQGSRDKIIQGLGRGQLHILTARLLQLIYEETEDRNFVEEIVSTAIFLAENNDPSLGGSTVPPTDVEVEIVSEYPPDYDAIYIRYREEGVASLQAQEIAHLIQDRRLDPEDLMDYYMTVTETKLPDEDDLFDGVESVADGRFPFPEGRSELKDEE